MSKYQTQNQLQIQINVVGRINIFTQQKNPIKTGKIIAQRVRKRIKSPAKKGVPNRQIERSNRVSKKKGERNLDIIKVILG